MPGPWPALGSSQSHGRKRAETAASEKHACTASTTHTLLTPTSVDSTLSISRQHLKQNAACAVMRLGRSCWVDRTQGTSSRLWAVGCWLHVHLCWKCQTNRNSVTTDTHLDNVSSCSVERHADLCLMRLRIAAGFALVSVKSENPKKHSP